MEEKILVTIDLEALTNLKTKASCYAFSQRELDQLKKEIVELKKENQILQDLLAESKTPQPAK